MKPELCLSVEKARGEQEKIGSLTMKHVYRRIFGIKIDALPK